MLLAGRSCLFAAEQSRQKRPARYRDPLDDPLDDDPLVDPLGDELSGALVPVGEAVLPDDSGRTPVTVGLSGPRRSDSTLVDSPEVSGRVPDWIVCNWVGPTPGRIRTLRWLRTTTSQPRLTPWPRRCACR